MPRVAAARSRWSASGCTAPPWPPHRRDERRGLPRMDRGDIHDRAAARHHPGAWRVEKGGAQQVDAEDSVPVGARSARRSACRSSCRRCSRAGRSCRVPRPRARRDRRDRRLRRKRRTRHRRPFGARTPQRRDIAAVAREVDRSMMRAPPSAKTRASRGADAAECARDDDAFVRKPLCTYRSRRLPSAPRHTGLRQRCGSRATLPGPSPRRFRRRDRGPSGRRHCRLLTASTPGVRQIGAEVGVDRVL